MKKWIKITCPCSRDHLKSFDGDTKYVTHECGKQLGFIPEDASDGKFANFCLDCKRVVETVVEGDLITITAWEKGKRIETTSKKSVVAYEL